jgi:hypothetical protein
MTSATYPLPFTPIAGETQKSEQLKTLLIKNFVSPFLRNRIKYAPRTSHTNSLGAFEAFAAKPTKQLEISLSDGSKEYALSEIAGRHWLELALAVFAAKRSDWHGWLAAFGYEMKKPADVAMLLKKTKTPLVEVPFESKRYLVGVAGAKKLVTDKDVGPASLTDLDAKAKAVVARAAKSKSCECFLCANLRKKF